MILMVNEIKRKSNPGGGLKEVTFGEDRKPGNRTHESKNQRRPDGIGTHRKKTTE